VDTTVPTVIVKNITVSLDINGIATITPSDINDGSTDNYNIVSFSIDNNSFDCSNLGANDVVLTITDSSNNSASATAIVTVVDTTAPIIIAQNLTIELNSNGLASITVADIDTGSTDNCGITSQELSVTNFDCSDEGVQTIIYKVTDNEGNSSTKEILVTVLNNDADNDNDGLKDNCDSDDDNDGTDDSEDDFPLDPEEDTDTDGDGTGDNADEDDDNDGIPDEEDADVDGDGINDNGEDTDGDGINDDSDPDIDGDGINNDEDADVDGDGVNDNGTDNDNDGVNDATDTDDDNDGVLDSEDNCPLGYNPFQEDRDNDGLGDVCDTVEINISEAVTPNGDGINDTWMIYNIENYPNNKVYIYNRYGKEVYRKTGYRNTWDGTSQRGGTTALPDNTAYFYQLDLDGNGTIDYKGWIYKTK
jgi:gliding motility-associated-like protein